MYLFANCKNCRKQTIIQSGAITRPELSMEKNAEEFNHQCEHCKTNIQLHVNDVRAKESYNSTLLVGGLIFGCAMLIFTYFLQQNIMIISTIPFLVVGFLFANEGKKVHAFNSYLIRRY